MSLTLTQARDAAIGVVDVAWKATGAASAAIPMHYDNVKSDKPGEQATARSNAAPYARTTVRLLNSSQITQGTRRYLTTGSVLVQIFTPSGDGNALSDVLVQLILRAFRAHVCNAFGLSFSDIQPSEDGDNGAHFMASVSADFRYQETV